MVKVRACEVRSAFMRATLVRLNTYAIILQTTFTKEPEPTKNLWNPVGERCSNNIHIVYTCKQKKIRTYVLETIHTRCSKPHKQRIRAYKRDICSGYWSITFIMETTHTIYIFPETKNLRTAANWRPELEASPTLRKIQWQVFCSNLLQIIYNNKGNITKWKKLKQQ